jgi:broad specificity phosphatase PhoE
MPRREGGASPDGSARGPCHIFLVRDGTSGRSVPNRYRGRWDVPLDAQGHENALSAARALSGLGLTAVYAGPLRRAITTAQIIADEAGLPDVRVLRQLNNLDYGMWHGLTAAEAEAHDPDAFALYRSSPLECICPNGERLVDAQQRMLDALQLMGARHPGETVVGVTHAVMIRLLVAQLSGTTEGWCLPAHDGGILEFQVEEGRIALLTPLPGEARETEAVATVSAGVGDRG